MSEYSEDRAIGRIIINLQSLEYCLRAFIERNDTGDVPDLFNLSEGEISTTNNLCSFDSLRELVDRFNQIVVNHKIDKDVVEVRNALAHGRLLSQIKSGTRTLFRFSKPDSSNKVKVDSKDELTEDWYKDKVELTKRAIFKVFDAAEERSYGLFKKETL